MFGFALLNSATFFFSCPMKVGEPHCMSQYFRTTLPFLSVPWPWVEPSPPPPPHAAAIRDRDARVAASVRRRRLVLAMETPWRGCYEGVRGRGPRKRCGAVGGLEAGGKLVPTLERRRGAAFSPSTTRICGGPPSAPQFSSGLVAPSSEPAAPATGASAAGRERRV